MDHLDKLSETHLYSLRTLKTPGIGRMVAKVLMVITFLFILFLFLPWQQNIRGKGKLTALSPKNRPQMIQSAIAGRITQWHIVEGDYVNKGDVLLSITEIKDKYFDPNLISRMEEQLEAKKNSQEAKTNKIIALRNQIVALRKALVAKNSQAKNKLKQASLKLEADSLEFVAEQVNYQNATSIFERNKNRYEAGNITLTKFQEIESKFQMSAAKVLKAENEWLQRKADLANAELELTSIDADYADKISKAQSNLNETISSLNETKAQIAKMENELSNVRIRREQYQIIAPQSGHVVKAIKVGIGETIKEGDAVATILPESDDKAVEMYVKAMDIPLIESGKKVRVQFDGWPALQFSGWPNVSVGTFGGIVANVDRVQSNNGMFRILVKPDPEDEKWPEQLRLGSGIKGWVMLNNVSVWYEIWRQMNGFPPMIYEDGEVVENEKKK
ncbi:Multidrug resistance efflux pump [Ekhidna lutea]|uniref:Multidrug resistance efflux pump n=1 Tax=Ekhidna lutea TaxID=447679 RepID=A0A239J971_EKHLU|nr:HlyD family efflux transporter periplasmic adaptor subunit [Ekhidna lutea]SNT02345.1 Multidrug resistance efflux pump [Ekhidna lutea]